MSVQKQVVTGTLVATGLVAVYFFVKKLRRLQVNLEVLPTASVYKINLGGLTIKVDVVLKNPTNMSLRIKFPFVKLLYKGTTIGSSQVVDKDVRIPAYGEAKIDRILIHIPLLETFSVAYSLVKTLMKKDKTPGNEIKVGVTVITTVFVGSMSMPLNETNEIPLVS